ncbi:MAG: helix-turn-helix transcriptional regulator [Ruthenibacterium lactatiformans]
MIHRCIQYISVNYKERITLEDTARMVYLSPAYLSRIFKQETGVTFNEYLNRAREQGEGTFAPPRAAHDGYFLAVGYEDQSYFTKVFKRGGDAAAGIPGKILVSRKD